VTSKASSPFLKKRTKKLLCIEFATAGEKFFASFFQKRRPFLALSFLLIATAAHAQSAPIQALDSALETAMKTGKQPFPARYAALAPVVDKAFDLPQILKTVVGLRYASIPPDQQQKLLATFRAYTISSYVSNFDTDSGDRIELLPETRTVGADRVVETQIVPKAGEPTRMDYVMRAGPAGWQAIDVLEQATISQAAVQRSDFRSLLASGPDKLIASLQAKIDTMSGGTIKP
jgi:phospholipid transport system substrate-binding protein